MYKKKILLQISRKSVNTPERTTVAGLVNKSRKKMLVVTKHVTKKLSIMFEVLTPNIKVLGAFNHVPYVNVFIKKL